jgi:hypothetical protein
LEKAKGKFNMQDKISPQLGESLTQSRKSPRTPLLQRGVSLVMRSYREFIERSRGKKLVKSA